MDKKEESGRELLAQHCRSCGGYFIIERTCMEHMTGKYLYPILR